MCLKHLSKGGSLQPHPTAQLSWDLKEQLGMFLCWIQFSARRASGRWIGWLNKCQEARMLVILQQWDIHGWLL